MFLAHGAQSGMQMFVIDPSGSDLARSLNRTRARGQITAGTAEEALFEQCLIGASRRTLRKIFGADVVEQKKTRTFFWHGIVAPVDRECSCFRTLLAP
jgi:hypothetical protein